MKVRRNKKEILKFKWRPSKKEDKRPTEKQFIQEMKKNSPTLEACCPGAIENFAKNVYRLRRSK